MLTVRLLGGFEIEHDGVVVDLGSARPRALIACLLLQRDHPLSRAHVAYLLWPDAHERHARTNLRKALHQLRHTLPDAERFMALGGQQLFWRSDAPYECDVQRFEAAAASTSSASSPERAMASLVAAADIYRGDLLPEMYEPWLEPERERLRDVLAHVLARLVSLHEEQHDYESALRIAHRLLRHDPFDEESHRRLMRLHALVGERAKALHVFHGCASMLQREFGIEPSPETRHVYERLLRLPAAASANVDAPSAATPLRPARRAPTLVGRAPQLVALQGAWHDVSRGRASMVLVRGDAGIGKTRLAKEFARSIPQREAGIAVARCHAAEGTLALAPVTELMRSERLRRALVELDPLGRSEVARVVPDLVRGRTEPLAPLTEGWQRRRLFETLARVVLLGQPLAIVIDDLPWCDRDTLEWLHFLLRFDDQAKLLVVATARAHDVHVNAALMALLAALRHEERLLELELGPLDEAQTAALVRSMRDAEPSLQELQMLFAETEGNPLFIVEMVRAGVVLQPEREASTVGRTAPKLPVKLREMIAARLAHLDPADLELATMAAVIGREFDLELLVHVSRQDEESVLRGLDELWRRRIVRETSAGRYDFSHDKLREVAYEGLSLTRRGVLHRYAAEALELQKGDDVPGLSGQLAYHYDRAGFPERAIDNYQRAGDEARALYAHEDARNAYQRALLLLDALPANRPLQAWRDERRAYLLEGVGDILTVQGDHDTAEQRFSDALAHRHEGEGVARARLWRKVGAARVARYRYDDALEAYDAAEAALGPDDAASTPEWWHEWIDIGIHRSNLHYWQVVWRESAEALGRIERAVERHGTDRQRAAFYNSRALMLIAKGRGRVSDEALSYARAALEASREADLPSQVAWCGFCLGFALVWRDALGEAQARLEEALRTSEMIGDPALRTRCLTYLGIVHRKRHDDAATASYARQALEAATDLGMPEYVGAAHGQRAWLAWKRGQLSACVREANVASGHWQEGQPYPMHWVALLPLLAARLAQGKPADAVACASAMLAPGQQRLQDPVVEALECVARAERAVAGEGADQGEGANQGEDASVEVRRSPERVVAAALEARLL